MLKNYITVALRNLWKNKTFSVINIAGLALGIACSLAIFMIVRHELSFDTFHRDYQRIYRMVTEVRYEGGIEYQSGTPLTLPDALRLDFPEIKKVATVYGARDIQIDVIDEKQSASLKRFKEDDGVFYINPDFFDIFQFNWIYGDAATVLSKPNQAALTKQIAEKYFGSWQNAVGKTIKKDNEELLQVAGILDNPPLNTDFPLRVVASYATFKNSSVFKRGGWNSVSSRSQCYFLLPGEESVQQFTARLPGFQKKHTGPHSTDYYLPQPLNDLHFNTDYGNFGRRTISKTTLWSLALIGVFLLLLACMNFINLATAHAIKRSKEVGIRKVLGGRRWQLALQFIGETFFITLIATLLAIGLVTLSAPFSKEIFNRSIPLQPLESGAAIVFVLIIILCVTLLSGFYPAIIVSGFRPIAALKNKIAQAAVSRISLRRVLVTAQFVIAQVLIIGTLVVISQVKFFLSAPLGFNKDAIITFPLPRDSASIIKWETFKQQLLQQPGVENVSFGYTAPASRNGSNSSFRFNQNVKDESFQLNAKMGDVDYLETYNLQLVAGRFYQSSDTLREAVVNETFLKMEGIKEPGEVLNKYLLLANKKVPIVGVVKDFHSSSLRDPIEPMALTTDKRNYRMAGVKLSSQGMTAALPAIKKIFTSAFPDYYFDHQFLDETIAGFYDQEQRLSNVFKLFAAMGILISCMGLYALVLFMSVQRLKEVGVRKILGASVSSIFFLFTREFVILIGIAFFIAAPVAWYAMHQWLQNFAYRITIDWWIFALTAIAALLISVITISVQTIKTALMNPVKSLRTE